MNTEAWNEASYKRLVPRKSEAKIKSFVCSELKLISNFTVKSGIEYYFISVNREGFCRGDGSTTSAATSSRRSNISGIQNGITPSLMTRIHVR